MVLGIHHHLGQHDSPLIYWYGLLVNYGARRYFQEVQSRKWAILHLRYPVHAQSQCHPVSCGWTACLGTESAQAPGYCCIPPCWPYRATACSSINHSLLSHLSELACLRPCWCPWFMLLPRPMFGSVVLMQPGAVLRSKVCVATKGHSIVHFGATAWDHVAVYGLYWFWVPWCIYSIFVPHLWVLCHHFPIPSYNKIMSFLMWNTGIHFIWKGLLCQIIQSFPSLLNVHTFSSHSEPLFLFLSSAIMSEDKPICLLCFVLLN